MPESLSNVARPAGAQVEYSIIIFNTQIAFLSSCYVLFHFALWLLVNPYQLALFSLPYLGSLTAACMKPLQQLWLLSARSWYFRTSKGTYYKLTRVLCFKCTKIRSKFPK